MQPDTSSRFDRLTRMLGAIVTAMAVALAMALAWQFRSAASLTSISNTDLDTIIATLWVVTYILFVLWSGLALARARSVTSTIDSAMPFVMPLLLCWPILNGPIGWRLFHTLLSATRSHDHPSARRTRWLISIWAICFTLWQISAIGFGLLVSAVPQYAELILIIFRSCTVASVLIGARLVYTISTTPLRSTQQQELQQTFA